MTLTGAILTVAAAQGFVIDGPNRSLLQQRIAYRAYRLPPPPANEPIDLLAPIGGQPSIWAECLFIDPVADRPSK